VECVVPYGIREGQEFRLFTLPVQRNLRVVRMRQLLMELTEEQPWITELHLRRCQKIPHKTGDAARLPSHCGHTQWVPGSHDCSGAASLDCHRAYLQERTQEELAGSGGGGQSPPPGDGRLVRWRGPRAHATVVHGCAIRLTAEAMSPRHPGHAKLAHEWPNMYACLRSRPRTGQSSG
jgi:hypothetical protein